MSRRDDMLREMGLAPIWRLRASAGALPGEDRSAAESAVATAAAPDTDYAPGAQMVQPTNAAVPSGITVPPRLVMDERRTAIMRMDSRELKASVASCIACPLHVKRNKTVFGVGDEDADWLFVGEGPGADEDAQGEPFVGQAGKLLDNMLAAIKLRRGDNVYIANLIKCRPPGNRNPEPAEALACEPYLHRQIELISPRLIIALGKVAAVNLLARDATIASLRGRLHEYRGIPLIVTYHPAYLLRSLPDKAKAWTDLCFAVEKMKDLQKQDSAPS